MKVSVVTKRVKIVFLDFCGMISVERITASYSNCYLVDGRLLIDAGMDSGEVLSRLEGGLETVVLTHGHYDHLAGVPSILRETGARLAVHREDAARLSDPHATVADLFGEELPGIRPDIILRGGETVGGLEVIHTPGHTPGSICLYHPGSRSLFSGDTVFPSGGVGRTDLPGGDPRELIGSLETLSRLEVDALYPGHGEPTREAPGEQIRLSLELARSLL